MSKARPWRIDGFAVRPDFDNFGYFNNNPDNQTNFWGIYSTRPIRRRISVDLYYLGIARKQASYNRGTAIELRHTLGARLWRSRRRWAVGTLIMKPHRSSAASDQQTSGHGLRLGNRVPLANSAAEAGVQSGADTSSGDDPKTTTLGTFNALFPVENYFGILQDTGPGPINFIDVHPPVEKVFPHGVSVLTDLLIYWRKSLLDYWRKSLLDGVYSVPGSLIRPAGNSLARFGGTCPGWKFAGKSTGMHTSDRLRNLLCWPVSPTNDAR